MARVHNGKIPRCMYIGAFSVSCAIVFYFPFFQFLEDVATARRVFLADNQDNDWGYRRGTNWWTRFSFSSFFFSCTMSVLIKLKRANSCNPSASILFKSFQAPTVNRRTGATFYFLIFYAFAWDNRHRINMKLMFRLSCVYNYPSPLNNADPPSADTEVIAT